MKNIFFDFNGTILNDLDLCFDILNIMLERHGFNKVSLKTYKESFTFPIQEYYKKVGFDFDKVSFAELSLEFIGLYQERSLNDCFIFDDFKSVYNTLKDEGYGVYLCSATKHGNLIEQTDHFGITDLFDGIVGLSDIYATSKKEAAKDFIEMLGIDPKTIVFIGDTLHDKEVADFCGTDCVLVSTGHQSRSVLETSNAKVEDSLVNCLKHF